MATILDHVQNHAVFSVDSDEEDFNTTTSNDAEEVERGIAATMKENSTTKISASTTVDDRKRVTLASLPPPSRKSVSDGSSILDNTGGTSGTSHNSGIHNPRSSTDLPPNRLTTEDLEICQRLDEEYERALEEREVGYNARYASVRQSAVLSVFFMLAFIGLGTLFFKRQAAWTIPESMLFSIYAITTVGYGKSEMPTTPGFQLYLIFYILVGIAALTIMVAQVYQCIALEATRAQHARDRTEFARRSLRTLPTRSRADSTGGPVVAGEHEVDEIVVYTQQNMPGILDNIFRCFDRARTFFKNDEIGRGISVLIPFAGLILIGAIVVGPIEEWTTLESVYFAVVSLTTVGFGDYVPEKNASIIFCIFWLPFSVGFMSMYLGSVAAFYIRLSDRNVRRIERQMRRRLQRAKNRAEKERAEVLQRAYRGQEVEIEAAAASLKEQGDNDNSQDHSRQIGPNGIPIGHAQSLARRNKQEGFDVIPMNDGIFVEGESADSRNLFGSSHVKEDSGNQRRQRIIENSHGGQSADGATMQSMRDVLRTVHSNLSAAVQDANEAGAIRKGPDNQFMTIRSTQTMKTHGILRRKGASKKPSFALRVLVQERFAEIIATDIAGFHSNIEIEENTLSVTIDILQDVADKWLVPRRARKPFRSVAFEVLYFVGEHGLITRGASALYDLTPFEFHGLFAPLLAAMGDADSMESWLDNTDVLAAADLTRDVTLRKENEAQRTEGIEAKFSI